MKKIFKADRTMNVIKIWKKYAKQVTVAGLVFVLSSSFFVQQSPVVAYATADDDLSIEMAEFFEEAPLDNSLEDVIPFDEKRVGEFIIRLYETCFGRTPDDLGFSFWLEGARSGSYTGAFMTEFFVFSEEMKNMALSSGEYVDILYSVIMGRSSDEIGKSYWVNYLLHGVSRTAVLRQFLLSQEFSDLCMSYGISLGVPGLHSQEDENCDEQLFRLFVQKKYQRILSRNASAKELYHWADAMLYQNIPVVSFFRELFFSEEFDAFEYTNEEYIVHLNDAFGLSDFDETNVAYWSQMMEKGVYSRKQVFEYYAYDGQYNWLKTDAGIDPSYAAFRDVENEEISELIRSLLGIRYFALGQTPERGFDNSGFVQYVFKTLYGMNLPHKIASIALVSGQKIEVSDMQAGDIIFYDFEESKGDPDHIAIYIGNGKIVQIINNENIVLSENSFSYDQDVLFIRRLAIDNSN